MKTTVIILLLIFNATPCGSGDMLKETTYIEGVASWYSENDPGILPTTANMEVFDDQKLTCAMWDLPFDTLLRVINRENGKSIVVRVNDRGPARRLVKQGRVIDLTKEAFSRIAPLKIGLIPVEVVLLDEK